MPTPLIYWNTDTGAVSLYLSTLSPLQIASTRGDQALQVVLVRGTPAAPYLPASDQNVGVVVRNAVNLKAGCLAGPTVLNRGANAAAGFTGTTSTDTTLTRSLMHVDPDDATSELPSFVASARFYLTPTAGSVDNVESVQFAWEVDANYYRPLQPPADAVDTYPPAADVDTIAARNTAIAAAVDNDPRIVNSVQRVATVAALRSLSVPNSTTPTAVSVSGYYAANDVESRAYNWNPGATNPDDGGAWIKPGAVSVGTPGRWQLNWNGTSANVRWWGAKADGASDDFTAITSAMAALQPFTPYSPFIAAPSGLVPPNVCGTLFFPASPTSYRTSGEILFSYFVKIVGEHGTPTVQMLANSAPSSLSYVKYVFRQCPLQSDIGQNNEFGTYLSNLILQCDPTGNPASGLLLAYLSETSVLDRVSGGSYGTLGVMIYSARCHVRSMWIDGNNCTGPGLVVRGEGFSADSLTIQHAFQINGVLTPTTDATGHVVPAIILNCFDTHIGQINCEASPLGIRIVDGQRCYIGEVFGNDVMTLVDIFGNAATVSIPSLQINAPAGPTPFTTPMLTDTSSAYGVNRNVALLNDGSGWTSYTQRETFNDLTVLGTLTTPSLSLTSVGIDKSAPGQLEINNGIPVAQGGSLADLQLRNLGLAGAIYFDGGLSGSDGNGNVYVGNSLYLGDSTDGAGLYASSGGSLVDDDGGWMVSNHLTVTGTISGQRACRYISADATVIVSQSGSTPPDEVFLVDTSAHGITINCPSLGLASGQTRRFTVIDIGGSAANHPVTFNSYASGSGGTLNIDSGVMEIIVDFNDDPHTYQVAAADF